MRSFFSRVRRGMSRQQTEQPPDPTDVMLSELVERLESVSAQLLQVRQEQGHLNRRIRELRHVVMLRDRMTLELVKQSQDLSEL